MIPETCWATRVLLSLQTRMVGNPTRVQRDKLVSGISCKVTNMLPCVFFGACRWRPGRQVDSLQGGYAVVELETRYAQEDVFCYFAGDR
jgi:hypothetical protein